MNLLPIDDIRTVGLAGAGSVGYGWAALMLAHGFQVVATDPAEGAEEHLRRAVTERWPALVQMGITQLDAAPLSALTFVGSLEEMAALSDIVQENAPEAPQVKLAVIQQIDAVLPVDRLILSSSGGVPPSQLQGNCRAPGRVLLGHPFHPAHIIPLVEVVAGEQTSPEAVKLAMEFYRKLGKKPIRLNREVVGHLSNRLQFALLREASHCLASGVASASEIDAAMRWGLGPRWALMGSLMTFNLAGGEGGLASLLERFSDDVQGWWDSLAQTRLTPEVRASLVKGAEELAVGRSICEWEQWRDDALLEFFKFRAAHPYPGEPNQAASLASTTSTVSAKVPTDE